MKRSQCLLLAVTIISLTASSNAYPSTSPGSAPAQSENMPKKSLKEKLVEIPPGSPVEVKLRTKEKFRGRLGDVSDEVFVVKVATGDKIEDRKVAFDDVKSVKKVEGTSAKKVAGYSVLAVGAAVGILVVVGLIAIAAAG
jgi:preprotein translocase subunit SecF